MFVTTMCSIPCRRVYKQLNISTFWPSGKVAVHRLIKNTDRTREGLYLISRPTPVPCARNSVTRACTDSRARKPLQLRDKSATLSRAWVVIVRHLDYILITRAGDGRWPRYQAKSLACPGCVAVTLSFTVNNIVQCMLLLFVVFEHSLSWITDQLWNGLVCDTRECRYDMLGYLTHVSLPKVWKKYLGVKISIWNF